jgi:hypothetical protein
VLVNQAECHGLLQLPKSVMMNKKVVQEKEDQDLVHMKDVVVLAN